MRMVDMLGRPLGPAAPPSLLKVLLQRGWIGIPQRVQCFHYKLDPSAWAQATLNHEVEALGFL